MRVLIFMSSLIAVQAADTQAAPGWGCAASGRSCNGAQLFASAAPDPLDVANGPTLAPVDPYRPPSAWAVCPPQPYHDFVPESTGDRQEALTNLTGDLAARDSAGTLTVIGDAEAIRADQRIRADRLVYSERDRVINVEGRVRYDEPDMTMFARHGKIWLDEERAEFHDTGFRFYDRHARGGAAVSYLLQPGISRYEQASYTTCADDSNVWKLNAGSVTIYEDEGEGVARNARLNVKSVPVLYTPYLSFPIDDRRKTGLLIPSFGSSENSGFELRVPYYFNLAPNYDATLAPRYLQDRGLQLNTEFRYLRENQRGIINVEYLPDDDITGDNRSRIRIRDTTRFGDHLTTNIDYDRVSDPDYLIDLGDSLSLASISYLQRTFLADYNTRWWDAGLRIDDYQTVDPTIAPEDRPYERLPRLTFNAFSPVRPANVESGLSSELVRFDQDARVVANRLDLNPSIRYPLRRAAYEITPKIGMRYTKYQLDNQDPGQEQYLTRTTPIFSLDNVLYLERDFRIGDRRYLQTLEPRLFYLFVERENQQDIPLFDTSVPTFTYRELFEENRFNGADRMGDANQLAVAVTTRLMDPDTGAQRARASIGELFYFRDRTVTLENTPPVERSRSDIAGELEIALSRAWSGRADLVWDPIELDSERANARIQYNPGFRKIANLSYRYLRQGQDQQGQDQIDASFLWPLGPAWQVLGRWYYDIDNTKKLETLLGIEYDSCCWGVRLVGREYIDGSSAETNRAILFQFVLKGLGRVGSDIESLLEDGILGYTDRPEE
ncbi:MAG: LPS assembly protein LptD [Gammaproteobacteria bacterium]|jgi:LPS-assembly protein